MREVSRRVPTFASALKMIAELGEHDDIMMSASQNYRAGLIGKYTPSLRGPGEKTQVVTLMMINIETWSC